MTYTMFLHNNVVWYFYNNTTKKTTKIGTGKDIIATNENGFLYGIYTDFCGKTQESNKIAVVKLLRERTLQAPNSFTPNGDGTNEIFQITEFGPSASYIGWPYPAYDAKDFKLEIYNRWGTQIASISKNHSGPLVQGDISWDGKFVPFKDDPMDAIGGSVYVYRLQMLYCSGEPWQYVKVLGATNDNPCIRYRNWGLWSGKCIKRLNDVIGSQWAGMINLIR